MANWSDLAFLIVLTISFIKVILKFYNYEDEYYSFVVDELNSVLIEAISNNLKCLISRWFLPCFNEICLLFILLFVLFERIVNIAIVILENLKLKKLVKLLTWIKKLLIFSKFAFLDVFLDSVVADEVLALLCKDIIEKTLCDKNLHENHED